MGPSQSVTDLLWSVDMPSLVTQLPLAEGSSPGKGPCDSQQNVARWGEVGWRGGHTGDIKAMVFPVVMSGCESWTVKRAERQRIDAFELWC